ncbi:Crp/Fnr family transcriptional regulator [Streptomyces megasporus]|uniref:Crp/Fnr family transcriptional regulator n=1 Tax=Streptomyces megasporus TaxID=44060 RepID=UPI000A539F88|nr:Crp/Fnr family transcriptional regulator [Streptomyces megasporus]
MGFEAAHVHGTRVHSEPSGTFSPDELRLIRDAGRTRVWRPGAVLFPEGGPPDSVVLVEEGLVKITADADTGYTSLLAIRGPGELVGEMSCVDGRARSATATAMRPVRGTVVASDRFLTLLERNGSLTLTVLRGLAARLRDADGLRADQGALPSGVRVARVLLDLVLRHGAEVPGRAGERVLSVSQRELAGAAGTSRESVVRTLRRLHREGLVSTSRGRTVVLDPRALARWAGI